MKTKSLFFLFTFILFFNTQQSIAGITLIQSFSEQNITGETEFSDTVSGAGDVNNDGYDDVIIGAEDYDRETGRAYIYYGGPVMDNTVDVTLNGENLTDSFGCSVSGAGDVNNDGYHDVIVGASNYNTSTGRAYIYYGGAAMDNTADVTMNGENQNDRFGCSVSGAGDVNNNGYDDVIVGADSYNSNTGRAYIYYGGAAMNPNPSADLTITGEGTSNRFGSSVSGAGDVNNDGYDDVFVGAPACTSNTGRAYICYGGAAMDNSKDVTMQGQGSNNYFGNSVSGAGDVNNDGYADLIVGAFGYNNNTGRAYTYYGGAAMPPYPSADITMEGQGINNYFGCSVSGSDDVNNDGYDDVIVGAHGYNNDTGRAYIYYGGAVINPNPSADLTMDGEGADHFFGVSVSGAGDVNNDGFDDVIVGAQYIGGTGRAYVYFGGSPMNNNADVTMTGEYTGYFGVSVSGAGDVNNDGFDDVIIGDYQYNAYTGRAYIYYGGATMNNTADLFLDGEATGDWFGGSVSGAGDVNNDGYDDVIVSASNHNSSTGRAYVYYGGSPMNNVADVTMDGENQCDEFGVSVSGAGNVNNNDYDDVIVGAWNYNNNTGRAYIYYGGPTLNPDGNIILDGEGADDYFGISVSGAGDVNNDNFADVIVGAAGYSSNTGRAYIYYGGPTLDPNGNIVLNAEGADDYFGGSVSGAGDVNNDGFDDVIVGAAGYNVGDGRAYIYYGDNGSPMDNTADVLLGPEIPSAEFGVDVSGAGDVNNDGFDDVIVGTEDTDHVYIYFGGAAMDNTVDVTLDAEQSNTAYGESVSGAGDVNNDGYDEVIVGDYVYPVFGKAYLYGEADSDGDGCPDVKEGAGDRDGDTILDKDDYDPTGYFYDEADGRIIAGGSINVTGPGVITIVQNGSSGYYQFLTDGTAGIYTIHVTLPLNYLWSTTCVDQGTLDPPATPNPYVIGNGENGTSGYLTSNACTNFYLQFDLEPNDPFIFNNNFPLANQAPTAVTLSAFYAEVGQDGILTYWTTETEPDNAGFNIYRATEENEDYSKINDSLIPARGDATTGASYSYVDKSAEPDNYYYKLQSVSLTGATSFHGPIFVGLTSVDLNKYTAPDNYTLSQNYPNPFNPETTIEFGLPKPCYVEISVYDINGKLVRQLVSEQRSAGNHIVNWNANDESGNRLTSGIYYYQMKVNDPDKGGAGFQQTNRMILMK